jgi:DNA-directed RNA polymerase subunit RPC12/RpoP
MARSYVGWIIGLVLINVAIQFTRYWWGWLLLIVVIVGYAMWRSNFSFNRGRSNSYNNLSPKMNYSKNKSTSLTYRRCLKCGHVFPVDVSLPNTRCTHCSEQKNISGNITPQQYNAIRTLLNHCHNCNRQLRETDYACGRCEQKVDYEKQIIQSLNRI